MKKLFELTAKAHIEAKRLLPDHCRQGVLDYFEYGHPVGDFLMAVLSDSFLDAVCRADSINIARLRDYAEWLYSYAPARGYGMWGSREAVTRWIKKGIEANRKTEGE